MPFICTESSFSKVHCWIIIMNTKNVKKDIHQQLILWRRIFSTQFHTITSWSEHGRNESIYPIRLQCSLTISNLLKLLLGVGIHPHRGFETVTFAYKGKVEHQDNSGGGGIIAEATFNGWQLDPESYTRNFMKKKRMEWKGGDFQMVQLWINLPSSSKMTAPLNTKAFPVRIFPWFPYLRKEET